MSESTTNTTQDRHLPKGHLPSPASDDIATSRAADRLRRAADVYRPPTYYQETRKALKSEVSKVQRNRSTWFAAWLRHGVSLGLAIRAERANAARWAAWNSGLKGNPISPERVLLRDVRSADPFNGKPLSESYLSRWSRIGDLLQTIVASGAAKSIEAARDILQGLQDTQRVFALVDRLNDDQIDGKSLVKAAQEARSVAALRKAIKPPPTEEELRASRDARFKAVCSWLLVWGITDAYWPGFQRLAKMLEHKRARVKSTESDEPAESGESGESAVPLDAAAAQLISLLKR